MKRVVAAFVALIMIMYVSSCGNIVNEQLPRRLDTYTAITSWDEKYTLTLSDNSTDKSCLSLKIENESGGLIQTSLDYDESWFASYSAVVSDYCDDTLKAVKFKWGILLETADDFNAVMTLEYSDKLRKDELFASAYEALSGKYYRYGFFCNTVLQKDYDTMKSLCKEYFEKNEPNEGYTGIWCSLFSECELIADWEKKDLRANKDYNCTYSKKLNGFIKHYCEKITQYVEEGSYSFYYGALEALKQFPMNDEGYDIENIRYDIDSAFYLTSSVLDTSNQSLNEVFGVDSEGIIKELKHNSRFCTPVYYDDEFCGYMVYGESANDDKKPYVSFNYDIQSDDIAKFASMMKDKAELKKWCKTLGIDDVKDIYIGTADSDYGSEKSGFITYIVTDDENYVYLNNVVGLSALNGKIISPDELVKGYSDDFLNGVAKFPPAPDTD